MAIYGSVRNRTPGMINRTVASLELKTQKKNDHRHRNDIQQ